ncbi:hypothetical protein JL475_36270, partial [Streptomyces sp. M2CJ-2]|nr:hypothetical protein [Streptomyces sp. M2CJ-2]
MSDGLSYRKDVELLENCNPPLVERNVDEFRRIQALLTAVAPAAERVSAYGLWCRGAYGLICRGAPACLAG